MSKDNAKAPHVIDLAVLLRIYLLRARVLGTSKALRNLQVGNRTRRLNLLRITAFTYYAVNLRANY